MENIPADETPTKFNVHSKHEVDVLSKHFFEDGDEKQKEFHDEWECFKFHLLLMRRKWLNLKENLS